MGRAVFCLTLLLLALSAPARAGDLDSAFGKRLFWMDLQVGASYSTAYDMSNFNGVLGSNRADTSSLDALIDVGARTGFLIVGAGAFARLGFADLMKDPVQGSALGYALTPAAPMVAVDLGHYRLQAHYLRWGSFSHWSPGPSGSSISYGTPVGGRITLTRLGMFPSKLGLRFNASGFFEFVEYHQQNAGGAGFVDLSAPMRFMSSGAMVGFDF